MKLITVAEARAAVRKLDNSFDRYWMDKQRNKYDSGVRHMAFRYTREDDADSVARRLRAKLKRLGLQSTVTRTSVPWDDETRQTGGEYVRFQAQM